jgi:hypothetical protein
MAQALDAATDKRWATPLAALFAIAALVSTCFFYGFGVNLVALFLAATAVLVALSLTARTQALLISTNPNGTRYAWLASSRLATFWARP